MKKVYFIKWNEGGEQQSEHFSDYLDALDLVRELEENGMKVRIQEVSSENGWLRAIA